MVVPFLKVKKYVDQQVRWVQPKYDGHCIMVTDDGIYTRTQLDIRDKLEFMHIEVPLGTVVVGELHQPNMFSTDVKTLMNEQSDQLKFSAFAIPRHKDVCLADEDVLVCNYLLENLGFEAPGTYPVDTKTIEEWLELAVSNKQEGWVLKNFNYSGWYKIKPHHTLDLKVVSTTVSKSVTRNGLLKAVQVADCNGRVLASVGTGFSNDQRHVDRAKLIGRIAEIQYDGMAGKHLRFPRFVRWRDDKEEVDQCPKD